MPLAKTAHHTLLSWTIIPWQLYLASGAFHHHSSHIQRGSGFHTEPLHTFINTSSSTLHQLKSNKDALWEEDPDIERTLSSHQLGLWRDFKGRFNLFVCKTDGNLAVVLAPDRHLKIIAQIPDWVLVCVIVVCVAKTVVCTQSETQVLIWVVLEDFYPTPASAKYTEIL